MTDFESLLGALSRYQVEFIIIGGAAAIAHGSGRLTQDLDIVYERSPQNLDRLVEALSDAKPYLRGAPPGLPFIWDSVTLRRGCNFTLTSAWGDVDLLGEIPGGGGYHDLRSEAVWLEVFQRGCLCLSLSQLIRAKRSTGRPKDLEVLAELEAIAEEESR